TPGHSARAWVDVAANLDRPQVGPDRGHLGRTPWAAGSDPRSPRELRQRGGRPGDQRIAGVGPWQEGGERQTRRRQRGKILRRMNRQLRLLVEKRLFQLLDEHALAR